MTATSQPHVERALEVVDAERTLLERERTAFERFLRRVDRVQVAAASAGDLGPGQATLVTSDGPPDGLRELRAAYRETVMAVPHYDREYGESLATHAAAELGESVAAGLLSGAPPAPVVKEAVTEAAREARESRVDLLAVLDRERDCLRAVATDLGDLERAAYDLGQRVAATERSDELSAIDADLQAIEGECTDLLESRQELLHNRSTAAISGVEDDSLLQYLYGGLESQCPALTDIAACLDTVRSHRTRCLR